MPELTHCVSLCSNPCRCCTSWRQTLVPDHEHGTAAHPSWQAFARHVPYCCRPLQCCLQPQVLSKHMLSGCTALLSAYRRVRCVRSPAAQVQQRTSLVGLLRTAEMMMASFSLPWNPSTVAISTAPSSAGRSALSKATCILATRANDCLLDCFSR